MPQTKFQDIVFTAIMATFMVYGMICYNVVLNTGEFTSQIFLMALRELPIMAAIAFVLEFFLVGKVAGFFAFNLYVSPRSHPLKITLAISFCICLIMCPVMSAIATVLFNAEPSFIAFLQIYVCNLPMALAYQLCVCGPVVRRIFRAIFRRQLSGAPSGAQLA